MRRWLVVIEDPKSEFSLPDELEFLLVALVGGQLGDAHIARVQRGGMLADKVMNELPPVRHELMGRPRG